MQRSWLFLLAGIAVGAGVVFYAWKTTSALESPGAGTELAKSQQTLAAARLKIQALEETIAELSSELAKRQTVPPAASVSSNPPSLLKLLGGLTTNNAFSAGLSSMMMGGVQRQLNVRLAELKPRLNLTDQQEQQLKEMTEKKLALARQYAEKMFQGQSTKEDREALAGIYDGARTEMQQMLSADQWAEYQKYEAEERQAATERMTHGELTRLASSLKLTEDQQDKVYEILYQQNAHQLEQTAGGMRPPSDWSQQLQQSTDAKKAALRNVLTAEQFQSYENIANARLRMFQAFVPASPGP